MGELERAYIVKDLGNQLSFIRDNINEISEKQTSYPIDKGKPTASEITNEILKIILKHIDFKSVKLKKNKEKGCYEGNLLIKEIDKITINLSFFKVLGLKKNEVEIKEQKG